MKPRVIVMKARAQSSVTTLRVKSSKRGTKAFRKVVATCQRLLPLWEEKCFEVAIVSRQW